MIVIIGVLEFLEAKNKKELKALMLKRISVRQMPKKRNAIFNQAIPILDPSAFKKSESDLESNDESS